MNPELKDVAVTIDVLSRLLLSRVKDDRDSLSIVGRSYITRLVSEADRLMELTWFSGRKQ